jgi:Protein of unknown function (DUF664)
MLWQMTFTPPAAGAEPGPREASGDERDFAWQDMFVGPEADPRGIAGPARPYVGRGGHEGYVSLREVLVHMIEAYARHVGHADLLRERIDGSVGL